ncbi:MAG: hypothetical protein ABSG06_01230, partial [Methanoregula sp.]
LYTELNQYISAVFNAFGFVIDPGGTSHDAGRKPDEQHHAFRYTTGRNVKRYSTLRHYAFGNKAIRYTAGRDDEWHSAIRVAAFRIDAFRIDAFRIDAIRYTTGIKITRKSCGAVAGWISLPSFSLEPAYYSSDLRR